MNAFSRDLGDTHCPRLAKQEAASLARAPLTYAGDTHDQNTERRYSTVPYLVKF